MPLITVQKNDISAWKLFNGMNINGWKLFHGRDTSGWNLMEMISVSGKRYQSVKFNGEDINVSKLSMIRNRLMKKQK